MRQILFEIPLPFGNKTLPIFGFGIMLLLAYLICCWFGAKLLKKEGYKTAIIWDFGMAIFIGGILGARIFSLVYDQKVTSLAEGIFQFFKIWEGGLILYGAIPGGFIAYLIFRKILLVPNNIRTLQMADWIAPSLALGIAFGRIGCYLNGCCYGDYCDPTTTPTWLASQFPDNSPPYREMISQGWQTPYGFLPKGFGVRESGLLEEDLRSVQRIPGKSPAKVGSEATKRLTEGDIIGQVNEQVTENWKDLFKALMEKPNGQPITLNVQRGEAWQTLESFTPPRSLPLISTQLMMTVDAFLIFLLLWFLYPHRKKEGICMAVLMVAYGINRYHCEKLRLDNPEFVGTFTISQSISVVLILGGVVLALFIWKKGKPAIS